MVFGAALIPVQRGGRFGPNTYADPWSTLAPTSSHQAPATTVSPDTATETPSRSHRAPSEAVSFAVSVPLAQPSAGLTNTYTDPWLSLSPTSSSYALATSVSPDSATAQPSRSPAAPSEAVSLAVSVPLAHPSAGLTNTYTAPLPSAPNLSHAALATTVSPDTATDTPRWSYGAASEAVNFPVWVRLAQPSAGLTNRYADPWLVNAAPGAPATTVSPDIATPQPSKSPAAPSEAVSLAVSVPLAHPFAGVTKTYT